MCVHDKRILFSYPLNPPEHTQSDHTHNYFHTHTHTKNAHTHTHRHCQFKPLCQLAIWSEHDHHMQSVHPGWHWFARPTLQLPSSCQDYSRKPNSTPTPCNGPHLCRGGALARLTCKEVSVSQKLKYPALQLEAFTNIAQDLINLYIVWKKPAILCCKDSAHSIICLHHHNGLGQ